MNDGPLRGARFFVLLDCWCCLMEMCGLIKLIVYRQGVSDVWHVTREELKGARIRLAREGWVITHTEVL